MIRIDPRARRPSTIIWIFLTLALMAVTRIAGANDSGRYESIELFKQLAGSSTTSLEVWINDDKAPAVNVGDRVAFQFKSKHEAYLTAIYVDSHGVVTVLFPTTKAGDSKLSPGVVKRFPPNSRFIVEPPLGREYLLAMTTPVPLKRELFVTGAQGSAPMLDSEMAPAVIRNMITLAGKFQRTSIAAASFHQTVRGENRYAASQVVKHFTAPVTRGVHRRKLDLEIHFDTNKDTLKPEASEQLDAIGEALQSSRLRSRRFTLVGHTDDVGDDSYNDALSTRRAKAARTYLMEHFDMNDERLATLGLGESDPLIPETSDYARAMNRRVTLTTQAKTRSMTECPCVPDLDTVDLTDIAQPK